MSKNIPKPSDTENYNLSYIKLIEEWEEFLDFQEENPSMNYCIARDEITYISVPTKIRRDFKLKLLELS